MEVYLRFVDNDYAWRSSEDTADQVHCSAFAIAHGARAVLTLRFGAYER
jgi:hypothetical protein